MRRADDWQRRSIQAMGNIKEKIEESVKMGLFRQASSRFYLFKRRAKGIWRRGTDGRYTSTINFMSSLTLLIISCDYL